MKQNPGYTQQPPVHAGGGRQPYNPAYSLPHQAGSLQPSGSLPPAGYQPPGGYPPAQNPMGYQPPGGSGPPPGVSSELWSWFQVLNHTTMCNILSVYIMYSQ